MRLRDPWPLALVAVSFIAGVTIGLPRVLTVGIDFRELARSENNYQTAAVEAMRFFGDGLLGRYIGEQQGLLGGPAQPSTRASNCWARRWRRWRR